MELLLRFSKMRNWRVVEAADSEGVRRQCLLLPMEMNGIFLTRDGKRQPYMRFNMYKVASGTSERFAYGISPMIPNEVHDSLIRQGLASPDDKFFSKMCGGVRYGKSSK